MRNVGEEVVTDTTKLASCPAASSRVLTLFVDVWYLSAARLKPAPAQSHEPLQCAALMDTHSYLL